MYMSASPVVNVVTVASAVAIGSLSTVCFAAPSGIAGHRPLGLTRRI